MSSEHVRKYVVADLPESDMEDSLERIGLFNVDGTPYKNVPDNGRGAYAGGLAVASPGDYVPLPWTWEGYDDELLDLTDPLLPAAFEAGFYFVTTTVRGRSAIGQNAIDFPATAFCRLDLDYENVNPTARNYLSLDTTTPGNGFPQVSTSLAYWVPAGGVLRIVVEHDASSAVYLDHETYVVKIA